MRLLQGITRKAKAKLSQLLALKAEVSHFLKNKAKKLNTVPKNIVLYIWGVFVNSIGVKCVF